MEIVLFPPSFLVPSVIRISGNRQGKMRHCKTVYVVDLADTGWMLESSTPASTYGVRSRRNEIDYDAFRVSVRFQLAGSLGAIFTLCGGCSETKV